MLEHGLIFLISITCADMHKNYSIHEEACNKSIQATSSQIEVTKIVGKADRVIETKVKPTNKTQAVIYAGALVAAKAVREKRLDYAFNSKRIVDKVNFSVSANSGSVGLTWNLP